MTHVDRDPQEWMREQEERERRFAIQREISGMSLGDFQVEDLPSILRVMGDFEEGGYASPGPIERDFVQLEGRISEIKLKAVQESDSADASI